MSERALVWTRGLTLLVGLRVTVRFLEPAGVEVARITNKPPCTEINTERQKGYVLEHVRDSDRALSEMIRVTRNNGWIVVVDTDWGSCSIDTPEVDIERRLARVRAERQTNNGYSGRQLSSDAGTFFAVLTLVTVVGRKP